MQIFNNIAFGGGKNRQSNIEALRLLSMLMVLNLHSFWGYYHGSGIGQFFDFFRNSISICAVNVFLIISGFYGIKWKFKSLYSLVFQCLFYSFGVYLISVAFGIVEYNTNEFLRNIACLYDYWYFITFYLLLYFLSPLLNAFVDNSSVKNLLIYVIVLYICENFICRGFAFLNYILMYLIGRWLNKSNSVNNALYNPKKLFWAITVAITVMSYALFLYTPINNGEKMNDFLLGYSYNSPLIIIQAVFLFLIFARMSFNNKYINWCASSCLSIFLIHMHPTIKKIGYYTITESFYELPAWQHILYLTCLITIVFFGSILIDKIRMVISDLLYKTLILIINMLPQKLRNTDYYIPEYLQKDWTNIDVK